VLSGDGFPPSRSIAVGFRFGFGLNLDHLMQFKSLNDFLLSVLDAAKDGVLDALANERKQLFEHDFSPTGSGKGKQKAARRQCQSGLGL
jgi:hypothetical protein